VAVFCAADFDAERSVVRAFVEHRGLEQLSPIPAAYLVSQPTRSEPLFGLLVVIKVFSTWNPRLFRNNFRSRCRLTSLNHRFRYVVKYRFGCRTVRLVDSRTRGRLSLFHLSSHARETN
jgi:hypothetical protein